MIYKRKLGIVVDSSFNEKETQKIFEDASTVHLKIIIGDDVYEDNEIDNPTLLNYLNQKKKIQTSQANPNAFLEAFKQQFKLGYEHIICLTMSKKMSGTNNSAHIAKNMLNDDRITIIDTETVSIGNDYILKNLHYYLYNTKLDYLQICKNIVKEQKEGFLYFIVNDLKHLASQGRINKISSFIGNLFKIKPVLEVINGQIEIKKKIRNIKNHYIFFMNQIKKYISIHKEVDFYLTYVNKTIYIEELINKFQTLLAPQKLKIQLSTACPAISVSVGYGTFGIGLYKRIPKK